MVDQPWHNFSKSRSVHAKMGHVNPTRAHLGVICYMLDLLWSTSVPNLKFLSSPITATQKAMPKA